RRDGEDAMSTEDTTLPLVAGPDPVALADASPDWLARLRRSATARYGQLGLTGPGSEAWRLTGLNADKALRSMPSDAPSRAGLPGPRTEAWRFTGLNAVKALRPMPAAGPAPAGLPAPLAALDGIVIRIENGHLAAAPATLPQGVEAVALDDPAAAPGWVREALGSTAAIDSHPFTALNTAQFTGGIALRIAARAQVEAPILLTLA